MMERAMVDQRPLATEESFRLRLSAVMHPFLANAILTAAVANAPDEVRRDLSSVNADRRTKAEDSLVAQLVAGLYEPAEQMPEQAE